jgi:hypothetical protein
VPIKILSSGLQEKFLPLKNFQFLLQLLRFLQVIVISDTLLETPSSFCSYGFKIRVITQELLTLVVKRKRKKRMMKNKVS